MVNFLGYYHFSLSLIQESMLMPCSMSVGISASSSCLRSTLCWGPGFEPQADHQKKTQEANNQALAFFFLSLCTTLAPLNIKGGFICYRKFFDSFFFAFQKKTTSMLIWFILFWPYSSCTLYLMGSVWKTAQIKFSIFLHILYKDQIKLILMPIQWSLKTGLVTPCIYYTRTKVNLYFTLYTLIFFGKQDNLSRFILLVLIHLLWPCQWF